MEQSAISSFNMWSSEVKKKCLTHNDAIRRLAENECSLEAWQKLATSTLVTAVLFNRCRGGEPAKMKIEDMTKLHNGNLSSEKSF